MRQHLRQSDERIVSQVFEALRYNDSMLTLSSHRQRMFYTVCPWRGPVLSHRAESVWGVWHVCAACVLRAMRHMYGSFQAAKRACGVS